MRAHDHTPVRDRALANGKVERLCKKCEAWWPLEKFPPHPKGRRGRLGHCRMCRLDRTRSDESMQPARLAGRLSCLIAKGLRRCPKTDPKFYPRKAQ